MHCEPGYQGHAFSMMIYVFSHPLTVLKLMFSLLQALHDTQYVTLHEKPKHNVLTTATFTKYDLLSTHLAILKSSSPRRFGYISQMYSLYRSISESEKQSLSLCISD